MAALTAPIRTGEPQERLLPFLHLKARLANLNDRGPLAQRAVEMKGRAIHRILVGQNGLRSGWSFTGISDTAPDLA